MVLDVTYTYEDYAEANAAGATGGRGKAKLFGWVVFIGLAVLFFMMLSRRGAYVPPAVPRPTAIPLVPAPTTPVRTVNPFGVILPLLPWLLIFAFVWFFVFRLLRAVQRTPKSSLFPPGSGRPDPSHVPVIGQVGRKALAWVFVIAALAAGGALMVYNAATDDGGADDGTFAPLLRVAPWFLFAVALIVMLRGGGLGVRRLWEGQPHLQRPKRIEVADAGVVVTDAVSRMEHRWPSFTHARETKNLFLLYVSNYGFHMVPKRGFASTAEADEFREVIRRMIVDRPGPAFPVLPLPGSAGG